MTTAGGSADPGMVLDVLIPTRDRPEALAITLSGLAAAPLPLRIIVADQSRRPAAEHPLVTTMLRALAQDGQEVVVHEGRPRLGVAEQRDHLLSQARSPWVLFLDDDVWLRPWAISTLGAAMAELGCGLVGMAVTGLSYLDDHRPRQLRSFQPWDGPVRPERIRRGSPQWDRHELHNAANPAHLAELTGATPERWMAYRVAWIGGCVLYQRCALEEAGGFGFWRDLPPVHAGEDVVAQLAVIERRGGAGILPSGAIHLELPTTIPDRRNEAYDLVGPGREVAGLAVGER